MLPSALLGASRFVPAAEHGGLSLWLAGWHPGCGQAAFCPPVCQLTDVAVVPRFWLWGGAPSAGVWVWPLRRFPKSCTWSLPQKRREGRRSARVSRLVVSITHHLLVLMTQSLPLKPLPFPPSVLVITVSLGHPFKHEKFLITVKTHCSLSVRSVVSGTRPDLFFLLTCVGGFPCPEPAICHVMLKTGVFLYLRQKPLTHQDFKKRNKIYYPWSEGCIWR